MSFTSTRISIFQVSLILFVSTFLSFRLSVAAESIEVLPRLGKNVVDLHTHVACLDEEQNKCYVHPDFKTKKMFGIINKFDVYMKSFGTNLDELRSRGDIVTVKNLSELIENSKFVKSAIALALDAVYDPLGHVDMERTQVRVSNQFIVNSIGEYKNLFFGASVSPLRPDALARLEWVKKNGAVLNKWIPCIMGFSPAEERFRPFYKKLLELDLPLLSHTGEEHSFLWSVQENCEPRHLELPLSMGVQVIAAHLGTRGSKNLAQMRQLFSKYKNLWADNSSLTQINKFNHIKLTLEENFTGRIVYGSDYPLIGVYALGFPLVSHKYYRFHIPKAWYQAIDAEQNLLDRDIMLKLALGMPVGDLYRVQDVLAFPEHR
jgi:hypothetical protein